jgi:hypothetical protein
MSKRFIGKNSGTIIRNTLMLFLLASFHSAHAAQSDIQAELKSYSNVFTQGSFAEQRRAISPLEWSGISDPALYDIISKNLSEKAAQDNKPAREEASWYAKALALSGNEKYRSQLTSVATGADSKKLRKHANKALERLDLYAVWNPIISRGLINAPKGELAESRVKNMLRANNAHVIRLGAKRLHQAHSDNKDLVQLANERLLSDYQTTDGDGIKVDAMAWLIKALAKSGDINHKSTLEQIAETANNKKLKKYAKKYLGHFSG